jgi:hypothetical protein
MVLPERLSRGSDTHRLFVKCEDTRPGSLLWLQWVTEATKCTFQRVILWCPKDNQSWASGLRVFDLDACRKQSSSSSDANDIGALKMVSLAIE